MYNQRTIVFGDGAMDPIGIGIAQDGRKAGVRIALDLMDRIGDNVAGFAISAPFGNVKMALAAAGKIDINQI